MTRNDKGRCSSKVIKALLLFAAQLQKIDFINIKEIRFDGTTMIISTEDAKCRYFILRFITSAKKLSLCTFECAEIDIFAQANVQ
jgi:hypothetical protein